jgi:hypothetical protein
VAFEFWGRAWFSEDGKFWEQVGVGSHPSSCDGSDTGWHDRILAGASNGSAFILGGTEPPDMTTDEYSGQAISWVSADGRQWERSAAIADGQDSEVTAIWAVPTGWEATVTEFFDDPESYEYLGRPTVWQSTDGSAWERTVDELWPAQNSIDMTPPVAFAANSDGTRLLSRAIVGVGAQDPRGLLVYGDLALLVSADGRAWQTLNAPFMTGDTFVSEIEPPSQAGGSWLLITRDRYLRNAVAWMSSDLASWTETSLPEPLGELISTRLGLVAAGCSGGGRCAQHVHSGTGWLQIAPALRGAIDVVDGPGGVLLVGNQSSRVWHLIL